MLYPEFTRVWFKYVVGIALLLNPDIKADDPDAVHVNRVLLTCEVSVTLVEVLVHIDLEGGLLERSATG